jgi:hypothetical protein
MLKKEVFWQKIKKDWDHAQITVSHSTLPISLRNWSKATTLTNKKLYFFHYGYQKKFNFTLILNMQIWLIEGKSFGRQTVIRFFTSP